MPFCLPLVALLAASPDAGAVPTPASLPEVGRCPLPEDVCADDPRNLERAMRALEALPAPARTLAAPPPWDHTTPPASQEQVRSRFQLSAGEQRLLAKNGFVVLAGRQYPTYAGAYHDVYQSQLPIFVTVDSVMHAVFRSHDDLVAAVEVESLSPALSRAVDSLRAGLEQDASRWPKTAVDDVRVYLAVAAELLAGVGAPPNPVTGEPTPDTVTPPDRVVDGLVAQVSAASGFARISWAGSRRLVDFSAFAPRGHYTRELAPFFRGTMWLSRLDFVVARHGPQGPVAGAPRELAAALLLADLVARAGARRDLAALDAAWTLFAGPRLDVSPDRLAGLAKATGATAGATPAFLAALAKEPHVDAPNRPTAEGEDSHPWTTALVSARRPRDLEALGGLVNTSVRNRPLVQAGDVGWILGHDAARPLLERDLARYPTLRAKLDQGRALVRAGPPTADLYGTWFRSIVALADRPAGALPSFMKGEAFASLRLSSALAAFAQLKHNNTLMVEEPYEEGGCEIPDGYVEPALATWEALLDFTKAGLAAAAQLGDTWAAKQARDYFEATARVLTVLRAISRVELAGEPLPDEARNFLSMVVETRGNVGYHAPRSCPPAFSGWYNQLFFGKADDAVDGAPFLASVMTSSDTGEIEYLGARQPRLGVFVVDTGGPPRLMVGPIASTFEYVGSAQRRLTDADAAQLALPPTQRWDRAWLAVPPAPKYRVDCVAGKPVQALSCTARSPSERSVRLVFHDFHGVVLGERELTASPKGVKTAVTLPEPTQSVTFVVGEAHHEASVLDLVNGYSTRFVMDGGRFSSEPEDD